MPLKLSGNYYPTDEAARRLERTVGRICQMVRWGQIKAIQISKRQWLIPEKEIDRILKERDE